MGQERLSDISILNVARSRTQKLNITIFIDDFTNQMARKKNFCK